MHMSTVFPLVVLATVAGVASPATLHLAEAANDSVPSTGVSSSGDGTLVVVVLITLIVLVLLVGAVVLACRRYRGQFWTKDDMECPVECMSSTSRRGRPFLSSVFLQELKSQRPAPISVGDLTSTAVVPSATTAVRLQRPNPTSLAQPASVRSSELCHTGLGSIDDGSSIMESSSNILGSIRTEQTLSIPDSNVLSTFRSHETTSVGGLSSFRSHETTSVDDAVYVSGGRYSQQRPYYPHSAVSEEEGMSFHDTPSPKSILQEDVTIMRPHMSAQTSSSRGLNQIEYYQWARSMVANGVRRVVQ